MTKITAKEIKQKKVNIYISTGGDVAGELKLFDDIVGKIKDKRLNTGLRICPEFHIHGWDKNKSKIAPDEKALDECDIYVMILWENLGEQPDTKIGRVQAEFQQVLKRFRRTGAPYPMLYFRAINDASYLSADTSLKRVIAFRTQMELDKKSRFYNYESTAQFKNMFSLHLNQWLDKSRYGADYASHFEKPVIEYPEDIKEILGDFCNRDLVKEEGITEEFEATKKESFKLTLDAIQCAEEGKHTTAEEMFARAISLFEGPSVLNSYGVFLMARNFKGLAVQLFKKALSVADEKRHKLQMVISYKYIGDICEELGELETAEGMYSEALKLSKSTKSKSDTSNALRHLGTIYTKMFEIKKAEKMFKQAITVEKEVGRKDMLAEMFYNFGELYDAGEDLKQAEKFYNRAVELFRRISRKDKVAKCYLKLGDIYFERSNYRDATKVFDNALKLGREIGSQAIMSESYEKLGHVYWSRFMYPEAHKCFDRALTVEFELGRKEKMGPLYGYIGNAYRVKGDLAKAQEIFEKAHLIECEIGDKPGIASQLSNLGTIHRNKGELSTAENYYKQAHSLCSTIKDDEGIAKQCLNIGYVFQIRGDLKKAEMVFDKAAELYKKLGVKEGEASAYGSIGNVYLTRGDMKKTELMWDKSVKIMQSIEKDRMIKTLGSWVDSI